MNPEAAKQAMMRALGGFARMPVWGGKPLPPTRRVASSAGVTKPTLEARKLRRRREAAIAKASRRANMRIARRARWDRQKRHARAAR